MGRNLSGIYSLPSGSIVNNGDTSDASDVNTPLQDIEADLNTARPIVAGGTGATSASEARTNLGLGTGDTVQFGTMVAGFGRITTTSASRFDLQATGVADTHERTRLVRDTTAFRIQTTDSSASTAVDDYVATIGASGATDHQFNIAGTTAATIAEGTVAVEGTFPQVILDETDGTSTHRKVSIFKNGNSFQVRTLSSTNTSPATDFVMVMGASGATSHSFRVEGTERLLINSSGCTSLAFTSTSDAREKQDIAFLTEAEERVAARLKGLIRSYRWKADPAKKHFGVIAQDVIEVFEDEGLDWQDYGVITGGGDEPFAVNYAELHSLILGA